MRDIKADQAASDARKTPLPFIAEHLAAPEVTEEDLDSTSEESADEHENDEDNKVPDDGGADDGVFDFSPESIAAELIQDALAKAVRDRMEDLEVMYVEGEIKKSMTEDDIEDHYATEASMADEKARVTAAEEAEQRQQFPDRDCVLLADGYAPSGAVDKGDRSGQDVSLESNETKEDMASEGQFGGFEGGI